MLRFCIGLAMALTWLPVSASLAQTAKPAEKTQPGVPPLPEIKSAKPPAPTPVPDVWSAEEIAAAKARCTAALKGLNAVVTYEAPLKDGDCGNPAPIRLSRLDGVTFSPAALVNCGMLAPLHTWITRDLQPLAARRLRTRITAIEVMSDYSCRTAFGRVGKKLSQHAYVDALDIRGFVTRSGQKVDVVDGWGPTDRDIAAASKAQLERIAAAGRALPAAEPPRTGSGTRLLKPTRGDDVVDVILPGGLKNQQLAARLGGPATAESRPGVPVPPHKPDAKLAALVPNAAPLQPADTPRAHFLREAHAAACRIFGTTLGPEANEMHRNHFHVDMAQRKIKNICD